MRAVFSDPDRPRRWATAVVLAGLAAAAQWLARPWLGTNVPFVFFLPAIVAASASAGRGAGLFVTAAGFVSCLFWLSPPGHWWVVDITDDLTLLLYSMVGALLAMLGARVRMTSARASAAEQRLVLAGEDTGIGIFDLDLAARTVYLSPALALL
jgi:K+-sensing histidine kinase KdpD